MLNYQRVTWYSSDTEGTFFTSMDQPCWFIGRAGPPFPGRSCCCGMSNPHGQEAQSGVTEGQPSSPWSNTHGFHHFFQPGKPSPDQPRAHWSSAADGRYGMEGEEKEIHGNSMKFCLGRLGRLTPHFITFLLRCLEMSSLSEGCGLRQLRKNCGKAQRRYFWRVVCKGHTWQGLGINPCPSLLLR